MLSAILFCSGCVTRSQMQKSADGKNIPSTNNQTNNQANNPGAAPANPSEANADAPAASPKKNVKVGVILGPGGAKAFAQTGVLKELLKEEIPIDEIVGLEWGSLVAGLYAVRPQVNDVEWRLFKMQTKGLAEKGFFNSTFEKKSTQEIKDFLQENFGESLVAMQKVHFSCATTSIVSGENFWLDRGAFNHAIEKCLPYPPLFKASGVWMAAPTQVAEAVEYLKKKSVDVIVYVSVLDGGDLLAEKEMVEEYEASLLWHQVEAAEKKLKEDGSLFVVRVNTKGVRLNDFDKRSSLVLAGERAGKAAAEKLKENFQF